VHRIATIAAPVVLAGALALAGCGSAGSSRAESRPQRTASTTTSAPPVRPDEPVDALVPVGADGERMHLTCTGAGDETIVLVSGFGDDGSSWDLVAPELAEEARVCIPVRFGLGTSDAPPRVQTFATEAEDLHHLLAAAGEPGPYVVAGHSFGGAEAVAFAAAHPEDVTGLLLLDASPTTWPEAACAVPDDGSEAAGSFQAACASFSDPAANPERLDGPAAFDEVAQVRSLGDVPMAVLTRADVVYPGLAPASEQALAETWQAGQEHWASLSSAAEVVPVERTGHGIQLEQPGVVVDQVRALLD